MNINDQQDRDFIAELSAFLEGHLALFDAVSKNYLVILVFQFKDFRWSHPCNQDCCFYNFSFLSRSRKAESLAFLLLLFSGLAKCTPLNKVVSALTQFKSLFVFLTLMHVVLQAVV